MRLLCNVNIQALCLCFPVSSCQETKQFIHDHVNGKKVTYGGKPDSKKETCQFSKKVK